MSDDRPIDLAPGVTIRFDVGEEGQQVSLRPADLGPVVELDDFGAALVERLNGRMSIAQLLETPELRDAGDRARARQLLARLDSLGMVSTERAHQRAEAKRRHERAWRLLWGQLRTLNVQNLTSGQLDRLARAAPASDCSECKLHCCSYNVSVATTEVMTICKAAAAHGMRATDIFYPPEQQPKTHQNLVALRHNDRGDCIFLDADTRCIIHANAGPAHKPSACQLYPGLPILTIDGGRLGLRMGCAHARRDTSADGAARFRRMLERIGTAAPNLLVRQAPERVVMRGGAVAPWGDYKEWERAAAEAIMDAPSAVSALDRAVACLHTRWGKPRPRPGATQRVIATVSEVFAEVDLCEEAALLRRLDGAAPPATAPRIHRDQIAQVIESLEPLRFSSALAGLGVFRLLTRAAERDPRGATVPRETAAGWFRRLEKRRIRLAIAESDEADLEALAAPD